MENMKKQNESKKKLKQSKQTFQEFKKFISRGNVIDLAVGVIIGSAFGKIVTSMVNDLLMPVIGIFVGGLDFSNLIIKVGEAVITYGVFIQNVVDFLIVAGCIFLFIKLIEKFNKREEVKEVPKKEAQIVLLEEIRDLLKEQGTSTPSKKKKSKKEV